MKRQETRLYKTIKRRGKCKRLINIILCVALLINIFSGISYVQPKQAKAEENMLSNPSIVPDSSMEAGQNVTWDCIWFGSYPQAEVVPENEEYTALTKELLQTGDLIRDDVLYQTLQSATGWDEQGDIVIDGNKYRRIKKKDATYATKKGDAIYASVYSGYYEWKNATDYHYFKYQPVKWRVLSVDGNNVFLLSDKVLDDKPYHANKPNPLYEDVTWEESTVRSWLNGYGASSNIQNKDYNKKNFIDTAFGISEQNAIKETYVENKDNLLGTDGGNDTQDKVFLLSESEVYTNASNGYGFVSGPGKFDEARRAISSVYAKAMGADTCEGKCPWWLRTPGWNNACAALVLDNGGVLNVGSIADAWRDGVRPALNLDLAALPDTESSKLWSYAGTVCSIDYADRLDKGSKVVDKNTKSVYRITGTGKNRTVKYIKSKKKDAASIIIPDTVRLKGKTYKVVSVGKEAFMGREKLKTVKIGKNIQLIGKNAFSGCTRLKNVIIGENVQTIGADAFSNCTALADIIIPSKVAKIGARAFYQCKNLRYMVVKTKKLSAGNIGNNAFSKVADNIKVKTDKTKKKLYSKIFTASGMSEKALYIPAHV